MDTSIRMWTINIRIREIEAYMNELREEYRRLIREREDTAKLIFEEAAEKH